jgi:tetratricopeptide (TPR) repeat protein
MPVLPPIVQVAGGLTRGPERLSLNSSRMNTSQYFGCGWQRLAVGLLCLILALAGGRLEAEEPAAETGASSNDTLRAYLQLQEQLHATQLALERNRQETEALAARNAEAVAARFQAIEQALTAKRSGELESLEQRMQSTHRLLLIVAGTIASVGFVVLLLTAYLQWRAVNRLAEFSAMVQATSRAALPATLSDAPLLGGGAAVQSNTRLFGALTNLEKRILELEHTTQPPLNGGATTEASPNGNGTPANGDRHEGEGDHKTLLLAKGQSLLNLDKAGEALVCFEEILHTEPNHGEALVKKGLALEQLRQEDEALRCYDQAIAANGGLTIAYLQKGGLFNRLERYEEALQCYEKALHAQEQAQVS